MSLVGSLEDLGLGDILQIVSLSRKSGVLRLRCDGGEGRIVLEDGMVSGAAVKGDFEDTKDLLVKGGHVSEPELEAALTAAVGTSLSDTLAAAQLMTPEQLESVARTGVETAVIAMFEWRVGDFTFEVRDAVDTSEAVFLSSPLSSQYIAMEATRKRDEVAHFGDAPFDDDDGMLFSGEGSATDPVDGLALGTLERIEAEGEDEDPNESTRTFGPPPASLEPAPLHASEAQSVERGHLIAIDPDLGALEWLKDVVADQFDRVHIFQRAEIGVDRIRHYLGRGVVPVVIVAQCANADRPGGAAELVSRLRALAPAMQIAVLLDEGRELGTGFDVADGVLFRPASPGSDPENWVHYEDIAGVLRESLAPLTQRRSSPPRVEQPRRDPSLVRLKQISERLRDPSSDGDVLSCVLDFATEMFNRVALFMLREQTIDTIAQRGLDRAGGPGEDSGISFGRDEQPEVFRRVLDRRSALVSSMTGEADQRLALLLGTTAAKQAYLAPIESGGCVVALLYADNLPTRASVPDTTALEIVLHEAGMALDRELLRRALANSGSAV